jgi:hypothetical protein
LPLLMQLMTIIAQAGNHVLEFVTSAHPMVSIFIILLELTQ